MDVVNLSRSVFLAIIKASPSSCALVMYYLVVPESFHLLCGIYTMYYNQNDFMQLYFGCEVTSFVYMGSHHS